MFSTAGWYRDPSRVFAKRYWHGTAWTDHVMAPDATRALAPVQAHPSSTVRLAHAGSRTTTAA